MLNNFETKVYLPSFLKPNFKIKSVVTNGGDLYVIGDDLFGRRVVNSYSYSSKIWNYLPELPHCDSYYICSFMQKLFVISSSISRNSSKCMFYDTKSNKWCITATMKKYRLSAACTVFEGDIIISGGFAVSSLRDWNLKTVEAYDHHENKWSYYPNMLKARSFHSAVSMNNKMFMIGGQENNNNCEVFDSFTRKFTFVKLNSYFYRNISQSQIVSVGNKLFRFVKEKSKYVKVYSYDVENDTFGSNTRLKIENNESFSCTKVPMH